MFPSMLTPYDDVQLNAFNRLLSCGYNLPPVKSYRRVSDGLINQTYALDEIWIAQRVSDIFSPQVNEDIAMLVPVLKEAHVDVPMLARTVSGRYVCQGGDFGLEPGNWRLMTRLKGKTLHKLQRIEQIRALTSALARFHDALFSCRYVFKSSRPGVHDFNGHHQALLQAIETHPHHEYICEIRALYEQMRHLMKFIRLDSILNCSVKRIIHGDPKVSNFLWTENSGENPLIPNIAIIDLDTMARSLVAFEIGDAVRSWCNLSKEDEAPEFNAEFARELLGFYQEIAKTLTREERTTLENAPAYISLELSMRFARDAICEDYFGFDANIGHARHSYLRAKAMTQLTAAMLHSCREI